MMTFRFFSDRNFKFALLLLAAFTFFAFAAAGEVSAKPKKAKYGTIKILTNPGGLLLVIDGQNMFIHVGAITKSQTPNQLIGVIAHEAGHIAGSRQHTRRSSPLPIRSTRTRSRRASARCTPSFRRSPCATSVAPWRSA